MCFIQKETNTWTVIHRSLHDLKLHCHEMRPHRIKSTVTNYADSKVAAHLNCKLSHYVTINFRYMITKENIADS